MPSLTPFKPLTKMLIGAVLGIIALVALKGYFAKSKANYFADPGSAIAVLKKKINGPVAVAELDIRAKNIMGFKVQDPNHKSEINGFIVMDGKVQNEGPDLMIPRFATESQINQFITNVDEINFSVLPAMANTALANTKLTNPFIELVDFRGHGERKIWTIHLRDARGRNEMPEFDKNGAPIK